MYYEGGLRVPMFVYWPGFIQPGSVCDEPVISTDFYPTFLKLAGIEVTDNHILDGTSIVPLFEGDKQPDRKSLFWHFPAYLQAYKGMTDESRDPQFRTRPVSVIRKGDWKLLLFYEEWVLDGGRDQMDENNSVELYNLKNDVGERNNLALSKTRKRDELLNELIQWQKEIMAPVPTLQNPDYYDKSKNLP